MLNLNPSKRSLQAHSFRMTHDARRLGILKLLAKKPSTLKEIYAAVGTSRINEIMADLTAGKMIIYNATDKVYELFEMEIF